MDQGLNLIYGNVAERTLPRRQYQERVAVSYVTGSHNFKTGFSHRYVRIGDIDKLGSDIWMNNTGVEVQAQHRSACPTGSRSEMRRGISRRA